MKFEQIFIPICFFALIVSVFYIQPSSPNGFWKEYGYTAPTADNNLTGFSDQSRTFQTIRDIQCDITSDPDVCPNKQQSILNPSQGSDNIVNAVLKASFGGALTLLKALFLPKDIILDVTIALGIPAYISEPLLLILTITIVLSVFYFISNRGDLV